MTLKNLGNKGQTAVEYILLLSVVVALATGVFSILRTRMIGNAGECTAENESFVCKFQGIFNRNDNFKTFVIKR